MHFLKQTTERKDPEFINLIRSLPCCVCKLEGNTESHHLLTVPRRVVKQAGFNFLRGGGYKAPDRFSVPLCQKHHRTGYNAVHQRGTERHFGKLWILSEKLYENKDSPEECYKKVLEYEQI